MRMTQRRNIGKINSFSVVARCAFVYHVFILAGTVLTATQTHMFIGSLHITYPKHLLHIYDCSVPSKQNPIRGYYKRRFLSQILVSRLPLMKIYCVIKRLLWTKRASSGLVLHIACWRAIYAVLRNEIILQFSNELPPCKSIHHLILQPGVSLYYPQNVNMQLSHLSIIYLFDMQTEYVSI